MKQFITPLVLTAALALAQPAEAAPVSADQPAEARALILKPLTLLKLDDLHFGTIIPSAVSGTVNVPANGGLPTVAGGVTLVASDPPVRARFAGAGTPNQNVIITVPSSSFTLGNGLGDTVTVLAVTLDGSPLRKIDATRA